MKTITDHLYDLRDRKDKSVQSRVAELLALAKIAKYLADDLTTTTALEQEKAPT